MRIILAILGALAYIWMASFIWHIVPESRLQWWEFPLFMTTILLGWFWTWYLAVWSLHPKCE